METIILIFVGFVAWLYFAKFVNDNYQRSRGWSALFWFILLLGTVSFLFGSSGGGSSNSGGGGGNYDDNYYDNDEDDCHKNFWDNDNSDSCNSSWDSSDDDE